MGEPTSCNSSDAPWANPVSGIVYKLDHAYPGSHGGATVLEISTQGRSSAGRDYTNRLVGVFLFRDRRILLFREYFNPVKLG